MVQAEFRTVVSRPLDEVFAYLADLNNLPQYDRWVTSVEATSDGPPRVGSTWRHRRVQGGRSFDAPIELVEYEFNRRIAIVSGSNGLDVRSTHSFTADGDASTVVTEVLEMRLSGMSRLFEPIIRQQVPIQGAEVHARFKEILESR